MHSGSTCPRPFNPGNDRIHDWKNALVPRDVFLIGKFLGRFLERQQIPERRAVNLELLFEQANARFKFLRHHDAVQAHRFGHLREQRRHAARKKFVVNLALLARDERVNQAQPEIAQRLLTQKFFQTRFDLHVGKRIRASEHTVIALDTGEFRRERPRASLKTSAGENERVNLPVAADGPGYGLVRGGIRFVEDNKQVDIRNACDEVPSHDAAINAAGIEIVPQGFAQRSDSLIQD